MAILLMKCFTLQKRWNHYSLRGLKHLNLATKQQETYYNGKPNQQKKDLYFSIYQVQIRFNGSFQLISTPKPTRKKRVSSKTGQQNKIRRERCFT
jgi:hypothetical protein